jgi:type IV pilus assembly protein PilA
MADVRDLADDEHGFSLVEVMVVVIILGILIALAFPTLIGARSRAQDQAARATLRIALTAGRVVYSTSSARDPNDRYTDATIPELQAVEATVVWVDETTPSVQPTMVSKDTSTRGILYLSSYSRSGTCFFMRDEPPSDTEYGSISGAVPADCYAANTVSVAWQQNW